MNRNKLSDGYPRAPQFLICVINSRMDTVVARAEEYVRWEPNADSKKEVETVLEEYKHSKSAVSSAELNTRFSGRIAFGTAGLRAEMKAGYVFMNDLTVMQASQGLCAYLLNEVPDVKKRGVVVGYDGRHNSKRFAELTTAVFLSRDIPVSLFSSMVPTPFVAYASGRGVAAGVMVTASHNPKQDNGDRKSVV